MASRHEPARLAVQASSATLLGFERHRRALAALAQPPAGAPALARLAHHAEAAGDIEALLAFAPAAGDRAASLGAHQIAFQLFIFLALLLHAPAIAAQVPVGRVLGPGGAPRGGGGRSPGSSQRWDSACRSPQSQTTPPDCGWTACAA